MLVILSACAGSPEPISNELRCAPMPGDVAAEARRKPIVKGETGVEVAGNLINQVHRKNAAINRATKYYEACRKS